MSKMSELDQEEKENEVVGKRLQFSPESAEWLDNMSKLTGLSPSELVQAGIDMLKRDGQEMLANAIVAKSERQREALANLLS